MGSEASRVPRTRKRDKETGIATQYIRRQTGSPSLRPIDVLLQKPPPQKKNKERDLSEVSRLHPNVTETAERQRKDVRCGAGVFILIAMFGCGEISGQNVPFILFFVLSQSKSKKNKAHHFLFIHQCCFILCVY